MGSGQAASSLAYISFSFRDSEAMISVSSLASPGPSADFQRHWMTRPELVKLPLVSANSVVGRRNTSVGILLGSTSLNSPCGFQNSDVSVASGSITTMYFSLDRPSLTFFLLATDASGVKPWHRKPLTLPSYMALKLDSTSDAPASLGMKS